MAIFSLRFPKSRINWWAGQYPAADDEVVEQIAGQVRQRGYYTKDELREVCDWKSPRTRPRVAENDEGFVQTVSQTALSTLNEQLRIEVLTLLRGVGWPTASVLLHLGHGEPYPILDYRALWSLSIEVPKPKPNQYDSGIWCEYTKHCRLLAQEANVTMRTLDRALWQYSKKNQPS